MKLILLMMTFSLLSFANTELAEEEVVRQMTQEINVKSKNMVEAYYNKQAKMLLDAEQYDTRFRFEKIKTPVLAVENELSHYDSGIENEIGIRPQIFTSSKLRYTLTPEALRSLNPRDENNWT